MHVEKFHKNVAGVMLDHIGRSDSKRNCKRSNENIDPERTHLNYNIAAEIQPLPQTVFLNKRLGEIKVHGNASVHFFSWVVTAPKNLPESEHEEFFKACFDKFCNTYGKENIISCFVHRDESSEHLHCAIIPAKRIDKGEKLCAKEVITRSHLQKAHEEMEEYVSARLGHHVDILNGATKEGNKSLSDFKKGKAKEDIENAKIQAYKIVAEAKNEAKQIKAEQNAGLIEYDAKMGFVNKLTDEINGFDLSRVREHQPTVSDPEHYYKVPPDVFHTQFISKSVLNGFKEINDAYVESIEKTAEIEKENKELKRENIQLRERKKFLEDALEKARRYIERINKVLNILNEKIPNLRELFTKAVSQVKREENYEDIPIKSFAEDYPERD